MSREFARFAWQSTTTTLIWRIWDQSTFHNNESGSHNLSTLAVAGSLVPLVEGHADTRERWTATLMTFSDKQRLTEEGPPYCEFVFKADGEILQRRLQEHLRSSGCKWASVATSEKGSYRVDDVLNFLERHLPQLRDERHPPQLRDQRQWRIMMADDFSAHLSPHVVTLCWRRGYVFIPHGGGVTPIVQTVDTDLNQHVKRHYAFVETKELLSQMRDGAVVPRCRQEQCMDMMIGVLSSMSLHYDAADGYIKTGLRASLEDAVADQFIVREAGVFWKELNMREKVNAAVADVREEVLANRIRWTPDDVKRLILPYPRHSHTDAVLANMGDDTPEASAVAGEDDDSDKDEDGDGDSDASGGDEDFGGGNSAVADDHPAAAGAHTAVADDHTAVASAHTAVADDRRSGDDVVTSAEAAEISVRSGELLSTLEGAISALRSCGAMQAVVHLESEVGKEKRRVRAISREDPDVLEALARHSDADRARERTAKAAVAAANARSLSLAKLSTQLRDAKGELQRKRKAIADSEALLETKHAVKSFSRAELGEGCSRGGGVSSKKARGAVLDRLARLGSGLSPAQRNDFAWFKDTWDAKMLAEKGDAWPRTLMEWMQKVLDDIDDGDAVAFSTFVRNETARCFGKDAVLQL